MSEQMHSIGNYLEQFNSEGSACSRTFAFWSEYLDMVSLLLDFIEAERDSNWKVHLEACRNMLPYDHSFDHFKYLTWGLVYVCDMDQLAVKYPDVYDNFMMGKHTVSRSKTASTFNSVSTDMALEQSFNRDSKTKGQITSFLPRDNLP